MLNSQLTICLCILLCLILINNIYTIRDVLIFRKFIREHTDTIKIERDCYAKDYKEYLRQFNKSYGRKETKWRYEVFKKSVTEINRLNKLGGATYGWTKFTDVTGEELFMTDSGPPAPYYGNDRFGHQKHRGFGHHKHRGFGHQKRRGFGHHKHRGFGHHKHQKFCHQNETLDNLWNKKQEKGNNHMRFGHKKHGICNIPVEFQENKRVCKEEFEPVLYCPDNFQQWKEWDNRSGSFIERKIPDKVDWRESGKVGPVLNQKFCNGCWAFSIVGVMESMAAIQRNESDVVSLSIQELLDCRILEEHGCKHGNVHKYLNNMCVHNMPVVTDAEYPLTLFEEKCQINLTSNPRGRGIGCYNYKTGYPTIDEVEILKLLAFHGPLITIVNADPWRFYVDGIISASCVRSKVPGTMVHAVQIVGYDRTHDPPYYIIKNSQGETFGVNGYVKLAMYKNMCGLAEEIYYLNVY